MADELTLAAELDRALAGQPAGSEARQLASLLVAASGPARFEVADVELERALARTARPRPRRRPKLLPGLPLAAAAAAAVLLAWQLQTPGIDVQARAARADTSSCARYAENPSPGTRRRVG